MITLPTLVQELGVARLTNSVYVGTMKFTVEQVDTFEDGFLPNAPEVALLREQLDEAKAAYRTLDAAYALTLRSAITDDIAALDSEGDQLVLAVQETVKASLRMTFDAEKVSAAGEYSEFLKKYRIDTRENMISEWSKVQQLCEEHADSQKLQAAASKLGIAGAIDRLTVISTAIREKITQRSGEMPEAQQMKKARTAMDPEYRALIQVVNAAAIIYGRQGMFDSLIKTLNGNINYVKIHAMSKSSSGGDEPQPEPSPEPTPEPTPEPEPEA